ncbi:MAG: hypothetical protein ABH833_02005 [Parcubacteria group bacterium]
MEQDNMQPAEQPVQAPVPSVGGSSGGSGLKILIVVIVIIAIIAGLWFLGVFSSDSDESDDQMADETPANDDDSDRNNDSSSIDSCSDLITLSQLNDITEDIRGIEYSQNDSILQTGQATPPLPGMEFSPECGYVSDTELSNGAGNYMIVIVVGRVTSGGGPFASFEKYEDYYKELDSLMPGASIKIEDIDRGYTVLEDSDAHLKVMFRDDFWVQVTDVGMDLDQSPIADEILKKIDKNL